MYWENTIKKSPVFCFWFRWLRMKDRRSGHVLHYVVLKVWRHLESGCLSRVRTEQWFTTLTYNCYYWKNGKCLNPQGKCLIIIIKYSSWEFKECSPRIFVLHLSLVWSSFNLLTLPLHMAMVFNRHLHRGVHHCLWTTGNLISIALHLFASALHLLWLLHLFSLHSPSGSHLHSPSGGASWGNRKCFQSLSQSCLCWDCQCYASKLHWSIKENIIILI